MAAMVAAGSVCLLSAARIVKRKMAGGWIEGTSSQGFFGLVCNEGANYFS